MDAYNSACIGYRPFNSSFAEYGRGNEIYIYQFESWVGKKFNFCELFFPHNPKQNI